MKKLFVFCLLMIGIVSLVSCSSDDTKEKTIDDKVAEAQKMTTEELLAKAKEETGKFIAYGNTSRITSAMTNFIAKYGSELGLTDSNAIASKQSDTNIYTLLGNEFSLANNAEGASFVLVQDSATLATYREKTKMLTNYVPSFVTNKLDKNELVPLVHQYINKLFMWNNQGENVPAFTNVWQLTLPEFAGKIYFKNPNSEQVNMNFLVMLTSPEWTAKLETAYEAQFGKKWVKEDKYESISYKWIAEFLNNVDITSYSSDTKMAAGVSKAQGTGGLFVLSKLRDSSVTSENITVGAWEEKSITPFAGFMYSIYAQIATNAPRPYTAMLFANYLMTEEGFTPWLSSVGGYSSNPDIAPFEGDKSISFYKNCLVVEDGKYINSVKVSVEDYINKLIASK